MGEYPRCATCAHYQSITWKKPDGSIEDAGEMRCAHRSIGEMAEEYEAPRLSYPYNEGGCMSPSPDFGCVLHSSLEVKSDGR